MDPMAKKKIVMNKHDNEDNKKKLKMDTQKKNFISKMDRQIDRQMTITNE